MPEEDSYYQPPENLPPKAQTYLVGLARTGTVRGGVALARISYSTPGKWKRDIEDFEEYEHEAKEHFADWYEEHLFQTAPRNHVLTIFTLKGLRPDKYKDRVATELTTPTGGINVIFQVPRPPKENKTPDN